MGRRGSHRRGATALAVGFVMAATMIPIPAAATSADCSTTQVAGSQVQLCVTPTNGTSLTGAAQVTATVTVLSGAYDVYNVVFTLDDAEVLTDYAAPYAFTLSTPQWVDGQHTLAAFAQSLSTTAAICCATTPASATLTFSNGVISPPVNTSQPVIATGTTPVAGAPLVVAAVGDGAGGDPAGATVANMVASWSPNLFLYLGDVYWEGSFTEFANWYDPTYGQLRSITNPTIGNHEYLAPSNGTGYFNYWNNIPHWYSFDAQGWHFISLDANEDKFTVQGWNDQLAFLNADLAAHAGACIMAYWHQPLWNVGPEHSAPQTQAFWTALAGAHATLVLNGHDHDYQRWTAMDQAGIGTATGLTEIIAGTGGHFTQEALTTDTRLKAKLGSVYGAVKLSLTPTAAGVQFIETDGTIADSANVPCQGYGGLSGTVSDGATGQPRAGAAVSYAASAPAGPVSGTTTTDASGRYAVANLPVASYTVTVRATDYATQAATVDVSGAATPTHDFQLVPPAPFVDGFESGSLAAWDSSSGLPIETTTVNAGTYAVEGNTTTGQTFAVKTLAASYSSLYAREYFDLRSAATNISLLWYWTASGTALAHLYVDGPTGKLGLRNDITGLTAPLTGSPVVTRNSWHSLELHVIPNGTASLIEVWLDGAHVPALESTGANLGTSPIVKLQIGENNTARTYDVALDDVVAQNTYVGPLATTGVISGVVSHVGDGAPITGATVSYSGGTTTTQPGGQYRLANIAAGSYAVTVSASGYTSRTVGVTVPSGGTTVANATLPLALLTDGFENGLQGWIAAGVSVCSSTLPGCPHSGAAAAEGLSGGAGPGFLKASLPGAYAEIYYRAYVDIRSQGSNNLSLLDVVNAAGAVIAHVFVNPAERLGVRNDYAGTTVQSPTVMSAGSWHALELHVRINGPSSAIDVYLDGSVVPALSSAAVNLGMAPIGIIWLGENQSGRTFDFLLDDVSVQDAPVGP